MSNIKKFKVPSEITVLVDNRLVDYFDEIVEQLNGTDKLFNKTYTLSNGLKYRWSNKDKDGYKKYYIFIFDINEKVIDRFNHPVTEMILPKKYNAYITHLHRRYFDLAYGFAVINGEIQPPKIEE